MSKYWDIVPHEDSYTEAGQEVLGDYDKSWKRVHTEELVTNRLKNHDGSVQMDFDDFKTLNIIRRNTFYKLDSVVNHADLPSWAKLVCVQAGITGSIEPDFSNIEKYQRINDGSVTWIVYSQITNDMGFLTVDKSGYTVINQNAVYDANLKVDDDGYIVLK